LLRPIHRFSNIAHVVKWPITQVCQAWREVGIGIVYREVAFSSRDSLTLELAAVAGAINRVRRISLWLDTDSVLCGSAIARLTSPPLDRSAFKFATTLVVHLMGFAIGLRRMFPTAAHLRLDHQWQTRSERWPLYAEDLVRGLYLQHIDARKGHVSSQLLEVIRRHAATLQTLDTSFLLPMMLSDLVQDADGNPISYPQMHSLGLYCTDFTRNQNTWLFTSPGWERTLHDLAMHIDDKTIDTFKRCGNQVLQLLVALCKTHLISFDERFRLSFSIAQRYLGDFSQTLCMLRMPGLECELEQLIALIGSAVFESESDHEHNRCTDIVQNNQRSYNNAGLLIASRPVISQTLHTAEVSLEPGLAAIIAILCPSARHIGRLLAIPGAYIIRIDADF
ncbi:hypothetical protein DL89DRAFT_269696, partial [Linderina pennispora]